MQCPIDGTELAMTDRQGIEIDYCPKCRGVWLDRGELDKIIERSADEPARPAPPARGRDEPKYREDRDYDYHRRPYKYHRRPYKKKKSLLGEIFDF